MKSAGDDLWRKFESELSLVESALVSLRRKERAGSPWDSAFGLLERHHFRIPDGAMSLKQVEWITSAASLSAPHGLDVFTQPALPQLPALPEVPYPSSAIPSTSRTISTIPKATWLDQVLKKFSDILAIPPNAPVAPIASTEDSRPLVQESIDLHTSLSLEINTARNKYAKFTQLGAACRSGELEAVKRMLLSSLRERPLPQIVNRKADVAWEKTTRIVLCTIEVPDFAQLEFVKESSSRLKQWRPVSATEKKRLAQLLIRSLCIRAAYLVAMSDPNNLYDTVAVNARSNWFDAATGEPREGIVASLQAMKDELCRLQPGQLDPDACFRHLAGIATPNILNAAPIRPIFVMNTDDKRIVANRDITAQLPEEANLAAMPWEDFEHLVRQLFELMFASKGVEVKVTRASRDRGVDAIVFDPDPIRGGKYVIQAKRYTRTVDVAAVRDLYGTVMNEGANRGILVTTSSYGPDSYDFAKDKPISLIDGPNLLALLRKHGRTYRIDLEEARRLDAQT